MIKKIKEKHYVSESPFNQVPTKSEMQRAKKKKRREFIRTARIKAKK